MLQLTDKLMGQKFTVNDPNTEYTCVGWGAAGETLVIIGAFWDQPNNRYELKSFKLRGDPIKFKGQVPL